MVKIGNVFKQMGPTDDNKKIGSLASNLDGKFGNKSYKTLNTGPELNQPDLETIWIAIRPPKMLRDHPQVTIKLYTAILYNIFNTVLNFYQCHVI